ncbi:MAG: electron transfer flavoprotein subunit alpha/FixB family protein, partial [Bacteroidota bacterium]
MKVLAFAEQRDNKFRKSSFEAVQAAKKIADELKAEFVALVVGSGVEAIAKELGNYGASRVVVANDPTLAQHSNLAYAKVIAEVVKKESANIVFIPASAMGKD